MMNRYRFGERLALQTATLFLLLCFLIISSFFALVKIAHASDGAFSVVVTGRGETIGNARQDAIRQALQQTMPHFVTASRVSQNQDVILDEILSASSGYITSWTEIEVQQIGGEYHVRASVTVATEAVERTVELAIAQHNTFEGSQLFREQERRLAHGDTTKLKKEERVELFDRVFADYAHNAFEVVPLRARLSDDDPSIIEVDLRLSLSASFVRNAEAVIKAISLQECIDPPLQQLNHSSGFPQAQALRSREYYLIRRELRDQIFRACLGQGVGRYNAQEDFNRVDGKDIFCFAGFPASGTEVTTGAAPTERFDKARLRCYFLESAEYCKECYGYLLNGGSAWENWSVIARFNDEIARSTHYSGSCIQVRQYGLEGKRLGDLSNLAFQDFQKEKGDPARRVEKLARTKWLQEPIHYFFFSNYAWSNCYNCRGRYRHMMYFMQNREIDVTVSFDTKEFDLSRTASFGAIIGFRPTVGKGGALVKGLSDQRGVSHDGCKLLDDAITRGLARNARL